MTSDGSGADAATTRASDRVRRPAFYAPDHSPPADTETVARRSADRNAVPARCCARTLRCFRVTDIEKIWLPPHTQKPLRHPDGWLAGSRATRTSLSTSLKTSTRTTRDIARDGAAIRRTGRAFISRSSSRACRSDIVAPLSPSTLRGDDSFLFARDD